MPDQTTTEERTLDVLMTEAKERLDRLRETVRAADLLRPEVGRLERVIAAYEIQPATPRKRSAQADDAAKSDGTEAGA